MGNQEKKPFKVPVVALVFLDFDCGYTVSRCLINPTDDMIKGYYLGVEDACTAVGMDVDDTTGPTDYDPDCENPILQ